MNSGGITLKVKVVPNASRTEIAGWLEGALKVRLQAPPEDGKANKVLINPSVSKNRFEHRDTNNVMKSKAQSASPRGSVEPLRNQAGCGLKRGSSRMSVLAFKSALL